MSDVQSWLEALGLGQHAELFAENAIDREVLPDLTEQDLKDLGIPLGHCKKLIKAIARLQTDDGTATPELRAEHAPAPPPSFDAERRQLTVMFCDLAGSTALSTRMDPEDLRDVIRAYQSACEDVVCRYEGLVARYMGDGILAYFGYPLAHEDDAVRALHAGLELVDATAALRLSGVPALSSRIGIATGVVVVGELIGSGEAREREVLGETPNLAARLQSLARPNCVVVSDTTHQLAGHTFEFEDIGRHPLKGFDDDIQAWRVTATATTSSRFQAMHDAVLIPMVGREREATLIRDCWHKACEGEGNMVLLTGEPGIGKSRLVEGLREQISDHAHSCVNVQCSPYHTSSALYPFRAQVEFAAGLQAEVSNEAKLDRLLSLVDGLGVTDPEAMPLLGELLSIPTEGRYPPLMLPPQARKERTFELLYSLVAAHREGAAVLVVFEDAHWIDPTSTEFLTWMAERLEERPVLILMTLRAGHPWPVPESQLTTHIALDRMGFDESANIAARIAGGKTLPEEVVRQIVSHTDGVPLFVEEVTRHVLASGLLVDHGDRYTLGGDINSLTIPATLQDSLIARLDRLGQDKRYAQLGAMLGREFPHDLFAAVAEEPELVLETGLDRLVDSELVQRRSTPPPPTYSFSHALIRDAAYSTLVRTRRRALHARAADVLEHRFTDVAVSTPELVAYHYTEASETGPAVIWWQKAGRAAARRSANLEAIAHLEKGLALLEALAEDAERNQREIDMQIALGQAYFAVKGFGAAEVERAYNRAQTLCNSPGVDSRQIMQVTVGLWNFHMVRGNLQLAMELAQRRFQLSVDTADTAALPGAHQNAGAIQFHFGRFAAARDSMQEGIVLYDRQPGQGPVAGSFDPRMACLSYQSWALWFLGAPARALAASGEMLRIAEQLKHPVSLAFALFAHGCLQQLLRDTDAVEVAARRLIALCGEHHFEYRLAQGRMLLGWALTAKQAGDAAVDTLREGLTGWTASGAQIMGPYFHGLLAEGYLRAGNEAEALSALDTAFEIASRTGEHAYDSLLHLLSAEITPQARQLHHTGSNPDSDLSAIDGETHIRNAMEIARTQEARSMELRALVALARLLDARDEGGAAQETLTSLAALVASFEEGLPIADLADARALLTASD